MTPQKSLAIRLAIFILLVLPAFGLFSRWFFTVPTRPAIPYYNILWINADSFNKTHIPIYGYSRNTMPFTTELAKRGVVFDKMINPSGWTNENLVSVFSSLSSPVHGVETRMRNINQRWITPIELLRDYGYRAPRLQAWQTDQNHNELGFEGLDNVHPAEWIERHGSEGPFFLFHQFLGPHLPYNGDLRDTELRLSFVDPSMLRDAARVRRVEGTVVHHTVIKNDGSIRFEPGDSTLMHAYYDGELLLLDREIQRTVEALDRSVLRDRTIIVISADHGEELLEHGFVGHASTSRKAQLFDEIVNVPFIMIFPEQLPAGKMIPTQVRGIDIAPTLLELLGIAVPPWIEGRSLMPVLRGEETVDRPAFIQTSRAGYGESDPDHVIDHIRGVRADGWKLLHYDFAEDRNRYELYNLADDPGELHNVIDSYPQEARRLRAQLEDWSRREAAMQPPEASRFELRSPWQRIRDLFFRRKTRTEFSGVPSPPRILTPADSAVFSATTDDGRAVIRWAGEPDVPYVIAYDVGLREYHLTGEIAVDGNEKVFGPFPAKYWNTYLTLYSPYKVRVSIDQQPRAWSPWLSFEVQGTQEP